MLRGEVPDTRAGTQRLRHNLASCGFFAAIILDNTDMITLIQTDGLSSPYRFL